MARLDEIWSADWRFKVYERLAERGFSQMSEWLAARPGATYAQLAAELGDDVAPVQVTRLQLAEAVRSGQLKEAAKDVLVRYLREGLPEGWGHMPKELEFSDLKFAQVAPFASWSSQMKEQAFDGLSAIADSIWEGLQSITDSDWVPRDANDPIISAIFDRAWAVGRANLLDERLRAQLRSSRSDKLRSFAIACASFAVERALRPEDERERARLVAALRGQAGVEEVRAIVGAYDQRETSMWFAYDDGRGKATREEYKTAFAKTRAASAVLYALDGDPERAAVEAAYEAIAATDDVEAVVALGRKIL
jgi:hypothetical protein